MRKPTIDEALRALTQAADMATSIRIELDEAYLRRIAEVEAMPENQTGANKSGRWRGGRPYWESLRRGAVDGSGLP